MRAVRSRFYRNAVFGLVAVILLFCGWLVPIHLHGVDIGVLKEAARNSPATPPPRPAGGWLANSSGPVVPLLIQSANRENALDILAHSQSPAVHQLLACRSLTNTVLFPAASSASGQAYDVATAICGLLVQDGHFTPALADAIENRATAASRGGDSQSLEEILMDEMSLGERFDWQHLATFNARIEDPQTLATLAAAARRSGNQLPALYAAVASSQQPDQVARYLSHFTQTGLQDLTEAERYGPGAVNELLRRDQRIYYPTVAKGMAEAAPVRTATRWALHSPGFALALKCFLYVCAGLFLAAALQIGGRPSGGLFFARELLFASGVLLVALLLSEPFLAQENQTGEVQFRLRLPSVGGAVASHSTGAKESIMNTSSLTASLLTLLVFFILQALIYVACLARLAETLRQKVPARVKLKLLENEDHLFDAGLYLGFVGTIICLILVSLHIIQFSLMAAYSSTSFGIIFVSILKIFKIRPARRDLLLQAEEENATASVEPPYVTAP